MGTHRFDPKLTIRCGINSCPESYNNFESFRSHVYRKHREVIVTPHSPPVNNSESDSDSVQQHDSDDDVVDSDREDISSSDHQKRLAAMFLLKTREEHKVTQATLTEIVKDIQGLWRDRMENLKVYS